MLVVWSVAYWQSQQGSSMAEKLSTKHHLFDDPRLLGAGSVSPAPKTCILMGLSLTTEIICKCSTWPITSATGGILFKKHACSDRVGKDRQWQTNLQQNIINSTIRDWPPRISFDPSSWPCRSLMGSWRSIRRVPITSTTRIFVIPTCMWWCGACHVDSQLGSPLKDDTTNKTSAVKRSTIDWQESYFDPSPWNCHSL